LTVANTGHRDGDEVVQLYVSHKNSVLSRPGEELKAFRHVTLRAGEKQTLTFDIPIGSLAYWDDNAHRFIVERDRIEVRAGASSTDIRLRQALSVQP
jgi:beta-glucosidase